jgi:hypothetical protein
MMVHSPVSVENSCDCVGAPAIFLRELYTFELGAELDIGIIRPALEQKALEKAPAP